MLENKINGKIYIGQTFRHIEKRLEEHQTGKSSGCVAIYNAIKFHGWENFEKDWYECPDEDLNFDEELLVREMGTLSPDGYNLKEGGGGGKMSMESKQKMSESRLGEKNHMYGKTHGGDTRGKISESLRGGKHPMYGKTHGEETRQKMSEAQRGEKSYMYGKKHADETKRKMSESHVGKKLSEETKQKLSEAHRGDKGHWYGKTFSEETKRKMSEARIGDKNSNSKRVYQYALDGTFIDSFGSCGEAARHLKRRGDGTFIGMCALGKKNTAYGFKWSYVKI